MFQLCHTSDRIPNTDLWIFENKYDGERIKVIKKGKSVKIWNRNRKTNEHQFEKSYCYPEVVEDLRIQPNDFILDGEVACADGSGLDKFNRRALQTDRLRIELLRDMIPVKFYVFDVLQINGKDVRDNPLIIRKTILNSFVEETPSIEIVKYWFSFNVKELWYDVLKNNLEGIIAKRKDSVYVPKRTHTWLKIKNIKEMVVNVEGFKETSGRSLHGSLITDRCDVSLLTVGNKEYYFKHKPKKIKVRYYGVYPSGKLRNPVLVGWNV